MELLQNAAGRKGSILKVSVELSWASMVTGFATIDVKDLNSVLDNEVEIDRKIVGLVSGHSGENKLAKGLAIFHQAGIFLIQLHWEFEGTVVNANPQDTGEEAAGWVCDI